MGAGNFTDDFKRDAVAQLTERGYRWAIEDSFETAKNELASTTTRPDPGTAGTVMSRWSCWRSP